MKKYTKFLLGILFLLGGAAALQGQVANISYAGGPYAYTQGTAITNVTPANSGGSVPATPYAQVTTVAGSTAGYIDGTGTAAKFNVAGHAVMDQANSLLYVFDQGNTRMRTFNIGTGAVTTLAGNGVRGSTDGTGTSASLSNPSGGALSANGSTLYVGDAAGHHVRVINTATGAVTTLAGSGAAAYADGTGTDASFNSPQGMAVTGTSLYVSDPGNFRIRLVNTATGAVTTVAGSGVSGNVDGIGTAAQMAGVYSLKLSTDGSKLYMTDGGNSTVRVMNTSTLVVTTLAGGTAGYADGIGTAAKFSGVGFLQLDPSGTLLYLSDGGNVRIRVLDLTTNAVTTMAGGFVGVMDGTGGAANFARMGGLNFDASGTNLYVMASDHILKVVATGFGINPALPAGLVFDNTTGTISGTPTVGSPATTYTVTATNNSGINTTTFTMAVGGSPVVTYTGPNFYTINNAITALAPTNLATAATGFSISPALPAGLSMDASGNISGTPTAASPMTAYTVTATNANGSGIATFTIKVSVPPVIAYAGGPMTYASGTAISALAPTNTGTAVPATPYGLVGTLTGGGTLTADGTALLSAQYNNPLGLAQSVTGDTLYIGEAGRIRAIRISAGTVSTLTGAGSASAGYVDGDKTVAKLSGLIYGLAINPSGSILYEADMGSDRIRAVNTTTGSVSTFAGSGVSGTADGDGTAAQFGNLASEMIVDPTGTTLYVADAVNYKVRAININTGAVTTLAGSGVAGGKDGIGRAATFNRPNGIAIDATGTYLYIADGNSFKIRSINIASGVVTTLAGSGLAGSADGIGTAASFNNGYGIKVSPGGDYLYATDRTNPRIRMLDLSTNAVTTMAGNGKIARVDGSGTAASFTGPHSIVVSPSGSNLYIADYTTSGFIRSLVSTGYTIAPALSAGLVFDASTGTISGTPTTGYPSTNYTVTGISNGSGGGATTVNITVTGPAIISYPTPNFIRLDSVMAPLSVTSTASTPTGFSISPALPAGLSMDANGTITGTPTVAQVLTAYTVTTPNGGSAKLGISVINRPSISYAAHSFSYTQGTAITPIAQPAHAAGSGTVPATPFALAGIFAGIKGTAGTANGASGTGTFTNSVGLANSGGTLYVADNPSVPRIRTVASDGNLATLTGTAGLGHADGGTGASKMYPMGGSAINPAGTILYTTEGPTYNWIRTVDVSTGAVGTLAGNGTAGFANGVGAAALFNNPYGMVVDPTGTTLYVADGNNYVIRAIDIASGTVSTFAGSGTAAYLDGIGTAAQFQLPDGLAISPDGTTLYVADYTASRIRAINIATRAVTTLAGNGTGSFVDGIGTAASIFHPIFISVSPTGDFLYVTENYRVRSIELSTLAVTTLAGTTNNTSTTSVAGGTPTYANGYDTSARFNFPRAITMVGGTVYVTDYSNNVVRSVVAAGYGISPRLPAGLVFNATTGAISGTPTAGSIGTLGVRYTIRAVNADGSGSDTLNITIDGTPKISYATPNVYRVNAPIAPRNPVILGGVVTSYGFAVGGTTLPAGLALNTATGKINGTPTASSPVTVYRIRATNGYGTFDTTVTISVTNQPIIGYPTPNTYATGSTVSITPSNSGATGGTFSVGTTLPNGITLDASTGIISGVPSAIAAATTYTVTITDAVNGTSTAPVSIEVGAAPVFSYPSPSYAYNKSKTIDTAMATATGSTAAYSISPTLPAGLQFYSSNGYISGTPTAESPSTNYTVTATNTYGTATQPLSIAVGAILPVTLASFTATASGCTAHLAWQTATELNSSYYAIEASTNGTSFAQVAKVASGNSAMGGSYKYSYALGSGSTYFRLKAVDKDGRLAYSAIAVATGTGACGTGSTISVSPNPTSNLLTIQHLDGGKNRIALLDINGKQLTEVSTTGTTQGIDITTYASGIYLLRITNASGNATTLKVVKQ